MRPSLNESPYDVHAKSITEEGDYFEHATVGDQTVRVGDRFWDADNHYTVEVTDVVEKEHLDKRGRTLRDGMVNVVLEVDHPGHNRNISMPDEAFVEFLAEDRFIPHDANGWLPSELRM